MRKNPPKDTESTDNIGNERITKPTQKFQITLTEEYIKKEEVFLSGMAVKEELWKKGIGKKILSFFEKQAKKTGKRKVSVGAANAPTNVVGFYEKSGYMVVKILRDYTVMEKNI